MEKKGRSWGGARVDKNSSNPGHRKFMGFVGLYDQGRNGDKKMAVAPPSIVVTKRYYPGKQARIIIRTKRGKGGDQGGGELLRRPFFRLEHPTGKKEGIKGQPGDENECDSSDGGGNGQGSKPPG